MMRAYSIVSADFKSRPNDFVVTEVISFAENFKDTDNQQKVENLWLYIKKVGLNTQYLLELIAKTANISIKDIGYSGLKDRHAVTYQWISLRLPNKSLNLDLQKAIQEQLKENENFEIIKSYWHHKKLSVGTHKFNGFKIVLKNVVGHKNEIDEQLKNIQNQGIPNFFGEQRFGNDKDNLEKANVFCQKIINTKKPIKLSKKDAFLISVIRSHLFNQILQKRVENHTWNMPIKGDIFNLNGTHSLFKAEIDEVIIDRMNKLDIHATAPLFGTNEKMVSEQLANEIEQSVFHDPNNQLFVETLIKLNIKADRRALRIKVENFTWQWHNDELTLTFVLPAGAFATSVLDCLVCELNNVSRVG